MFSIAFLGRDNDLSIEYTCDCVVCFNLAIDTLSYVGGMYLVGWVLRQVVWYNCAFRLKEASDWPGEEF